MSPVAQLPHAYPFLLLDRIVMRDPGRWAVGMKNLTRDDPLLDADGILPPTLLAEAMAQAAGLAVVDGLEGGQVAVLAAIARFRCRSPIGAGDQLLVTARVVKRFGATAKVRASIVVAGRHRAAAELVLHFAQR